MAIRTVKETGSQNLSAGALSLRAVAQGQMKLALVSLKASVSIIETITLTIDQSEGASYDVTLDESTLNSEDSYIYKSGGSEIILNDGDALSMACTNANGTGIVYAKILLIET